MKIQNVAIIYRDKTPRAKSLAKDVCEWLRSKKINVFFQKGKATHSDAKAVETPAQIKNLHLVLVLGGDGTYLEAVRFLGDTQVPVLGINLGSLGFLTENRVDEVYEVLESALNGKMKKEPVALMSVQIKTGQVQKFIALNDIVIERGQSTHLLNIGMYWDGDLVTETKADGMIISTPTGSTAYSFSAGGPIVWPSLDALLLVPLSPHALFARPLVVGPDSALAVEVLDRTQGTGVLWCDGRRTHDLPRGARVIVRRSPVPVRLARLSQGPFTDRLVNKFSLPVYGWRGPVGEEGNRA